MLCRWHLQSDIQAGLINALNIVSHYARRYRVLFNADKTKIVVTGSRHDMDYFSAVRPWTLNGERINVVTNNEHLGLIVSGLDEELKNVDQNITQCRNSLFSLLGPALSYKCKLSPKVQLHICPTSYAVRLVCIAHSSFWYEASQDLPEWGFLKQSFCSPVASLYFLCGELPVEARLHIDLLTIFYNIWANPQTKVFDIVLYIMKMSSEKSTTWSNNVC